MSLFFRSRSKQFPDRTTTIPYAIAEKIADKKSSLRYGCTIISRMYSDICKEGSWYWEGPRGAWRWALNCIKTLRLNRSSLSWSTYYHQWSIEWLLEDEKEVESDSRPSNHSQHMLDAADYFQRILNEIPRVQSASNGSRCHKPVEAHRGAFKFTSPLGLEIWKYDPERLPFGPHLMSAIPMCTRVWAEGVLNMELLSQWQDLRNWLTTIFTWSQQFCGLLLKDPSLIQEPFQEPHSMILLNDFHQLRKLKKILHVRNRSTWLVGS